MIQISQLTLPINAPLTGVREKAASLLRVHPEALKDVRIVRQSIDARKKPKLFYVYTVTCCAQGEESLVKRAKSPHVTLVSQEKPYQFPQVLERFSHRPVVVGMGPGGLFAALSLAKAGVPVTVLERGRDVDQRSEDVARFWETGQLAPGSNVQFGEGGAGAFSDGKLTTGTHDIRIRSVLETLVRHGAPEEILYTHKPHVGTDVLRQVVKSLRLELVALGCEVRFSHRLKDLILEDGALKALLVEAETGDYRLDCNALILAPGHSARDTFDMLHARGLAMEQKPFAIGVRIEHRQAEISRSQFGADWELAPPSDYKLSCHLPSGRSAFSFCVCPGGEVIAAASQEGRLVTNGMSRQAREGANINGGFLVGVGPEDYPGTDPLAGVRFQEEWERLAWALGGRNFRAPAQLVGDFLADRPSKQAGSISPSYRPGVTWTDLRRCLPDYVTDTLKQALPIFDRRVRGFAHPDSVLTGVETRSSSPLRILRDRERFQASVQGIYPCGEGPGYAGGIMSAAVDGIKVAEAVARGAGRFTGYTP